MHKIRQPYTFLGEPNIRLRTADYNGWHVQIRESVNTHWVDVPSGYYLMLHKAVEAVRRMIE
jgi:hypothetical protein